MKRTAVLSAAICLCLLLGAVSARACGDKLLYLSRIYLHRVTVNRTVAVYARPGSLLADVAALGLARTFRADGYQLLLIDNDRDLTLALQSGAPDVVIADAADIDSIRQRASAAKVPIIPVIGKSVAWHKAEARQYVATIKTPLKTDRFLDALDKAFGSEVMHASNTRAKVVRASLQ
ncbi:MAG TPA: hypothetical protein VFI20_10750 [Terracidiphilus sp.]|nr:hypothetical protein [Terracidiphilus sp.]